MSNNFNVTAALNKNGTISCSWSGVAGADSYQVRICDFGSKVFYHEVITTTSCVTPDKVRQGVGYRITVWATKKGGNSLASIIQLY